MPDTAVGATFEDADGITIHYRTWAAEHPRAVVQIAHGVGEHSGRYEELARALVAAGCTAAADDHRGHGLTGLEQHDGDARMLGRLGPGGVRAADRAVHQFTEVLAAAHPGVPIVLLGHSWGSFIAQNLLNQHAGDYAAAVLSGTAYRLPILLNGGDLAKRHRQPGGLGLEWLSRDPAVWQAFHDDPLTFSESLTERFGRREALRLIGRPARGLGRDLPLYIIIGGDDVVGGERSVRLLARAYQRRSRLSDVSVRVYPEARHELFNEYGREEVTADLVAWLDERLPPRG